MYWQLNKSIYITLLGPILFYEKLARQILDEGFEMNLYDQYTSIKIVDGNNLWIQYFIDDLHISSENKEDTRRFLKALNNKFKVKYKEVTVYDKNVHNYLRINVDYSHNDYTKFIMYDIIEDLLKY